MATIIDDAYAFVGGLGFGPHQVGDLLLTVVGEYSQTSPTTPWWIVIDPSNTYPGVEPDSFLPVPGFDFYTVATHPLTPTSGDQRWMAFYSFAKSNQASLGATLSEAGSVGGAIPRYSATFVIRGVDQDDPFDDVQQTPCNGQPAPFGFAPSVHSSHDSDLVLHFGAAQYARLGTNFDSPMDFIGQPPGLTDYSVLFNDWTQTSSRTLAVTAGYLDAGQDSGESQMNHPYNPALATYLWLMHGIAINSGERRGGWGPGAVRWG